METYIPDARSSAIFRRFVNVEAAADGARVEFWRRLPDLPSRPKDGHKGTFGTALIVGGSRGMSGAVALSGMTALVAGAGLTRLVVPDAIQDAVAQFQPEYTTIGAPSDVSGRFSESALDVILEESRRATVVAVGPGLGRSDSLDRLVERLYLDIPCRAIFDADALNALASTKFFGVLPNCGQFPKAARVLTPHPGEFERIFGVKPQPIRYARELLTVVAAEEIGKRRQPLLYEDDQIERTVLLLKGRETILARSALRVPPKDGSEKRGVLWLESESDVNETGNSNLATGGSGDALTGVIAGLIAQGLDAWDGARLGVALHGLAAELRALLVPRGAVASDVARFLPCAMAVYDEIRKRTARME